MSTLRNLTALIVEPHAGMRNHLHNMLGLFEIGRIDHAVNAAGAIRQLRHRSFDLVLCEYDLGDGQDGQQLLEDVRHHKLIPLSTIFFIVSSERGYEKVVGAAELAPSDYLLKPFTADALHERIFRAIEKRGVLLPVYQCMERGDLQGAIASCKAGEVDQRRYVTDFMRLRAELHVILGEASAAQEIYQALLGTKAVAWARLGLARTLLMQSKLGEAEDLLAGLVEESNQYMDAYDWLARAREAAGKLDEAKTTLMDAVAISPNAIRRLRKLGDLAMESGDAEVAQRVFQKVVARARYSDFRDPEDHVRLVRALLKKGNTEQAASVARDMERNLSDSQKISVCRALTATLLHQHRGDALQARAALSAALAATREAESVSNELKMEIARQCFACDDEAGATEIMRDVMSNSADAAAMSRAAQVFEQAGKGELAQQVAKESRRQVADLVSRGADRARQGDYQGAIELMTAAVRKLPDNPQVVFNAAVATLKHLEHRGWDVRISAQARSYIEAARRLDPVNPRLAPLAEMYQGLLKKYQQSSGSV